MKSLKNVTVRKKIIATGLSYKQVAEQMGIASSTLSHYLAYDLRPDTKARIEKAIAKATEKGLNNGKGER
jgi:predicted transcriptional regulator